jgi:hypothetical protein
MSDAKLLRLVTEHLRSFERSVFRMETLDDYTSDLEDDAMRRYFAGELLGASGDAEYFGLLRLARAAGKPWQRVHAVTAPTPYLRFEIDVYYAQTEPTGEDIRILEHPDLPRVFGGRLPVDFWLFDDSLVLEMRYDPSGRIEAVVPVTDRDQVSQYLDMRDTALRHAMPLREYRAALRSAHMPAVARSQTALP